MKIERLSQDKIRIFLTFDDLIERGIQKEDMWREIPKVHDLFSDMMDQAYSELGFDPSGPLAVEVFALPAQGMVVIVTKGQMGNREHTDEDSDMDDEIYELEVTLEQSDTITFAFNEFEHVIQAAKQAEAHTGLGRLYHYKERWILQLEQGDMGEKECDNIVSLLSEYGEATSVTQAVLDEYGKLVMAENAVAELCRHFQ